MINPTVIYCTGLDRNLCAVRSRDLNSICAKIHRWLFSLTHRLENFKGHLQHPWDFRAHTCSIPTPLHTPYVWHLQPHPNGQTGWGTTRVTERTLGVAQSTVVETDWGPSERAWGWMRALNHRAKWTTAKPVYLHPDNATSLQHILQRGSHDQELEWLAVTSDDTKTAVGAVVLGVGGWCVLEPLLNLYSIICTYIL